MEAISRLLQSGLTTKQVAMSIGLSSQGVSKLLHDNSWVSARTYRALVELAESRGIQLQARDFLFTKK